jgi:hypothetical protein
MPRITRVIWHGSAGRKTAERVVSGERRTTAVVCGTVLCLSKNDAVGTADPGANAMSLFHQEFLENLRTTLLSSSVSLPKLRNDGTKESRPM